MPAISESKAETDVETPILRAVCSMTISQYLKVRWAKLNTHADASGTSNLCACSRITTSDRLIVWTKEVHCFSINSLANNALY